LSVRLGRGGHRISPRPHALRTGHSILTRRPVSAATSSPGLQRTLRSNKGLTRRHLQAYASCLQGAIRSVAAAASLTGRCRRPPMPQLGLGRIITLARLPFVTNGNLRGCHNKLRWNAESQHCRRTISVLPWHWLTKATAYGATAHCE
jgi:hypothetical protein